MIRKNTVFQGALSLGLTACLAEASSPPPAAQNTSPWEAAVSCCLDSPLTGPIGQVLSLLAIVVGGLIFAFAKDESKRALAAIVYCVGMLIAAENFLVWLFPL